MNAYVWQMNNGYFYVSPLGGRASAAITEDGMRLWRAGIEGPFESRKEAESALREWIKAEGKAALRRWEQTKENG